LKHHQYCPATIRAYLHSIEHFACWVSRRHIPLRSIDESLTHRFVMEHLSVCRVLVERLLSKRSATRLPPCEIN
jgi:site-specific recombinase XerD